jgi:HD-GYP domain-containing protein (c-di-GMP phosphodiesterase class II)
MAEIIQTQPKAADEKFSKIGQEFLRSFYAILKTASLYEVNNNRYIGQAGEFRQLVAEIFTDEPNLVFVYKEGYFFLNDQRIKSDQADEEASSYFRDKFESLNISGINIYSKADSREIDRFIFGLTHFKVPADRDEANAQFKEKLEKLQIDNIVPVRIAEGSSNKNNSSEKSETTKLKARKTFFSAIGSVQEIVSQAKSGNRINLAKTKRIVQGMVDQIIENESTMVELTVLRDFDEYTYVHSVNVCVLAIVLGFHLGLDKKRLSDLGVAALLHDIGKINLPIELVNKPDTYDDMDWLQMRSHPVFGVKTILKTRGSDLSSVRAIATAYEHHITYSGSGYPELLQKRTPCLFAQIVSIADSFNAMTSGRVYHRKRMAGDEVITNMVNRAGSDFNPLLLKVFINTIGIYPVGSVVRLNTNEIAIVSRTNPNDLVKPEVKIIADRDGLKPELKIIDLSTEEAANIHIAGVIDGDKYHIDAANYIDLG